MQIPVASSVLELGTGTGAIAATAARRAKEVYATDISPYAVRCAMATMRLNKLEKRVEVLQGDLFAPVRQCRFDVILFNLPYLARKATSLEALAWSAGAQCELIGRFVAQAPQYLKEGGSIQIVLTSAAPVAEVVRMIRRYGYQIEVVSSAWLLGFLERIYLLRLS
jgi:release factor glutamine methyltransferase